MQGITHIAASPQFTLQRFIDQRYEVLETMARRQWERTYLAIDTQTQGQPRCVVKEFCLHHNSLQTLQAVKARFEYEKNWMVALGDYPQVAHLLNLIVTEHAVYMVREFVPGEPLISADTMGDRWRENQVEPLLVELLSSLQFIHSKAGIHSNVHPGNIIRRESDGRFVLTDVCAISPVKLLLAELQIAEGMPGKLDQLGYFAKEQLWQRSRPNSDLYSLGMVCIHLLTGQCPWDLPREPQTGRLLGGKYRVANPRLVDALNAMTREHYRDRPQSAYDVLLMLDAVARPRTTHARQRRSRNAPMQAPIGEQPSPIWEPFVASAAPPAESALSSPHSQTSSLYEPKTLAIATFMVLIAGGSLALSRPEGLLSPDSAPKTLQKAEQRYQQGDLDAAIATAQTIPPQNASFAVAQDTIQRWQQEWERSVQVFDEMETAYASQQWLDVLRKGQDIAPTAFWNAQKAPFIRRAQAQVDQQGHSFLQNAFDLAYQHQFADALDALRRIPPEAAAYAQVPQKFAEYEQKRDIRAQYDLQQAYNNAQDGDFAEAIAYLQQIPPASPSYAIAQQKRPEYVEKLRIRTQAAIPAPDSTTS